MSWVMHLSLQLAAPDRPSASVSQPKWSPLTLQQEGSQARLSMTPGQLSLPRGLHLGHGQHSHILCLAGHSLPLGSATDAVGQPVPHFSQNPPSVGNPCSAPCLSRRSYPLPSGDGELNFPHYNPFTNPLYLKCTTLFYILKACKSLWVIE